MIRISPILVIAFVALPLLAGAETWKNVSLMDTYCLKDAKANPDAHSKECALQCVDGGYGLITEDGTFLAFDAAGNEMTVAALNVTEKIDHLRALVEGTLDGDTIRVTLVKIE